MTSTPDDIERSRQIARIDNQSLGDRVKTLETDAKHYATREWVLLKGYSVIALVAIVASSLVATIVRVWL